VRRPGPLDEPPPLQGGEVAADRRQRDVDLAGDVVRGQLAMVHHERVHRFPSLPTGHPDLAIVI